MGSHEKRKNEDSSFPEPSGWVTEVLIPVVVPIIVALIGADAVLNEARYTTHIYNITIGVILGEIGDEEPPPEVVVTEQITSEPELSTPTSTPDPLDKGEPVVEEDFEEEGAFLQYGWYLAADPDCDIRHENGNLVFRNEPSDEALFCNLALAEDSLPWRQVGSVEVTLSVESHSGDEANFGIGLYSSEVGDIEDWFLTCGVNIEDDAAEASFTGIAIENGLPNTFYDDRLDNAAASEYVIEIGQTYEFYLRLDYEEEVIQCYVDGQLLGELETESVPGLLEAQIDRSINSYRSGGADASIALEEVKIFD